MPREIVRLGGVCLLATAVGAGSWFVAAAVGDDGTDRPTAVDVEASLVTAAVERRVVVTSVSGRATVGFTNLLTVEAPSAGGRITSDPRAEGTEVREGDVLAEVDGRPIVALAGTTPMYRALTVGLSGPDVLQFESALERLGIDTGPVDGTFDEATERAVRAFYERVGSTPIEPTAEELAAYETARSALTQAQLGVLADRHALDRDIAGLDPSQRAELDNAVAGAQDALAKAQRDRATLDAELDSEIDAARADVRRADAAVRQLEDQVRSLPAETPSAERTQLNGQLDEARAAARAARAALDGLLRSRPNRRADGDEAVTAARRALDAAGLARTDALTSKERELLVESLRVSEQAVADAQARLADQAMIVAAGAAAHEIVFVPSFPRRVQAVMVQRGDTAAGTLVRLSGGDPIGRWFVSDAERRLLEVGMEVTLGDGGSGRLHEGSVTSIADEPGDPDATSAAEGGSDGSGGPAPGGGAGPNGAADGYLVELALRPGGGMTMDMLVGRDLQVTAPTAESDGAQLAVPVAAVSSEPDGTSKVMVEAGAGAGAGAGADSTRDVPITVGLVGGGYAEIRPIGEGTIAEGDRVVVGT